MTATVTIGLGLLIAGSLIIAITPLAIRFIYSDKRGYDRTHRFTYRFYGIFIGIATLGIGIILTSIGH